MTQTAPAITIQSLNVSSAANYILTVAIEPGTRYANHTQYVIESARFESGECPRPLGRAIEAAALAAYQAGTLRIFEYDQDGNKRENNLRYFDAADFLFLVRPPQA